MIRILVFGSTGMLGRYICKYFKEKYDVIEVDRAKFDCLIHNIKILDEIIKGCRPNIIINCIGLIPQRINTSNNDSYDNNYLRVNSEFPHLISPIAKKYNCKFIHITTDSVYNGDKGSYSENDPHTETKIYGLSKSLGEPLNDTVIRTSIIGEELENKKSLLEWVKSNKNMTVTGYDKHLWNGITCLELAKIIDKIITDNLYWTGVRHIYSPNPITKYDLIKLISNIYNLNISLIISSNPNNSPCDKTLSTIHNTNSLFNIPDIKEQITELSKYKII